MEDDLGQQLLFNESEPGIYQSPFDPSRTPSVGRFYQLHIATSDGQVYCSNVEPMTGVPPIGNIRVQPTRREFVSDQGNLITIEGFSVSIEPRTNGSESTYLRWDYRGAYAINTPDPCEEECPTTCWFKDDPPQEYLRIAGANQNINSLAPVELAFFLPQEKFDTAYQMTIKQFSLNADAFNFWQSVQKQRNNSGSIFDPTPGVIQSNIVNCNNAQEQVLGYFGASAVLTSEVMILREQLEALDIPIEQPLTECLGPNPGPQYCEDCSLLPESSLEIPAAIW